MADIELTDAQIVEVLASLGIDATESKYGFDVLQVRTTVHAIRDIVKAYSAAIAEQAKGQAAPVLAEGEKFAVGVNAHEHGVEVAIHIKRDGVTYVVYSQGHPLNKESAGIGHLPAESSDETCARAVRHAVRDHINTIAELRAALATCAEEARREAAARILHLTHERDHARQCYMKLASLTDTRGQPVAEAAAQADDSALRTAQELARAIWRDAYREDAPQFEVLDTMHGVLSQIDNMVSGMVRAAPTAQPTPPDDERAMGG